MGIMKAAVIVFPGSNCDRDVFTILRSAWGVDKELLGGENAVQKVWHGENTLPDVDLVVLPGGFSYGDYLRCGAMAARSPIMRDVIAHANRGGLLLGICNGFQILTETGLLQGTLLMNRDLKFLCQDVFLTVEQTDSAFTGGYRAGQVINVPIAHHEGNYYADAATLDSLEAKGQVAFRYCNAAGEITAEANPNGSARSIAGVFNPTRNVLGMMPHPERHAEEAIGNTDGLAMFTTLQAAA
jgi:phosphoribosylformylglycinamidine synthase